MATLIDTPEIDTSYDSGPESIDELVESIEQTPPSAPSESEAAPTEEPSLQAPEEEQEEAFDLVAELEKAADFAEPVPPKAPETAADLQSALQEMENRFAQMVQQRDQHYQAILQETQQRYTQALQLAQQQQQEKAMTPEEAAFKKVLAAEVDARLGPLQKATQARMAQYEAYIQQQAQAERIQRETNIGKQITASAHQMLDQMLPGAKLSPQGKETLARGMAMMHVFGGMDMNQVASEMRKAIAASGAALASQLASQRKAAKQAAVRGSKEGHAPTAKVTATGGNKGNLSNQFENIHKKGGAEAVWDAIFK